MEKFIFKGKEVNQEDYSRLMYSSDPDKISLDTFRKKFHFNINRGMADLTISDLVSGNYGTIDFDIYLPTKKMNLQRPLVWTELQRQELIISVLKGIKLPAITIVKFRHGVRRNEEIIKVIDGKQRLTCLIDFFNDKFSISHNGEEITYSKLTRQAQRELDHCISSDIGYEYEDDRISDDDLISWFESINFSGTPQDKQHLISLKS